MANALRQGLIGFAQSSLAPSLTALGPNRYLREKDFLTMVGIAFAAHIVVIVVAGFLPSQKITDIPVRALSFKIGGQDRIAALAIPRPAPVEAQAPAPASPPQWRATPVPLRPIKQAMPKIVTIPVPVKPSVIAPEMPRRQPQENVTQPLPSPEILLAPAEPAPEPIVEAPPAVVTAPQPTPLPSTDILTQVATPAIASNPQRFIREAGAAPTGLQGGQGAETTSTNGSAAEIRERYEQQISAWIQQHKFYPAAAGGKRGKAILRIRIDRAGYVRYYAIEQSAGHDALDAAALDMIRRANPLPAAPDNYPAGSLIEFLIPIVLAP